MRGRATGVVLPALAVLVLVGVVAIVATGSTPHGSGESRRPSDTLLDTLFTLYLLGIVAGGCLLVYGLFQRDAIRRQVASGRYRRAPVTAWILAFLVFAGFTYFRARHWKPPAQNPTDEQVFPGPLPRQGTTRSKALLPYEPDISWVSVAWSSWNEAAVAPARE
jgi:hypothetical protein